MKVSQIWCSVVGLLVCSVMVSASERPAHFKGKEPATLTEAIALYAEHNKQLAVLIAKEKLTAEELFEVHQLTYTLENALQKMNSEMTDIAAVLEEVHLASEKNDSATVKARAQIYLDKSAPLSK
jgi:hypothetical protein